MGEPLITNKFAARRYEQYQSTKILLVVDSIRLMDFSVFLAKSEYLYPKPYTQADEHKNTHDDRGPIFRPYRYHTCFYASRGCCLFKYGLKPIHGTCHTIIGCTLPWFCHAELDGEG